MGEEKLKKIQEQTHSMPLEYQWNNRILVVDDERDIAQSIKDILSPPAKVVPMRRSTRARQPADQLKSTPTFDFDVVLAHNFEEALGEVRKANQQGKPFAVGFFDVRLGDESDGFDLVREILKIQPDIFSVFVTAYNDRTVDSIHNFLGGDKSDHWDYLNKPFAEGEILQKARNFVSLYNLEKEKEVRDKQVAELHRSLVESERMTSVAAVARGVGHEFGNMLMQIMGIADLHLTKDEAEMRKGLDKIIDASQRAQQILDRFKDLSAPVERTSQKNKNGIHMILQEALDLLDHKFKDSETKVCKIKIDKADFWFNSTAMIQVFVNLSINSMYAMGKGGQIDYSVNDLGDKVEIRVRDYGPGIEDELIDKVMQAFFTTKGEKGTGLGLAICREIVEIEHEGEFLLQNASGKGLEVIMRLPKEGVT